MSTPLDTPTTAERAQTLRDLHAAPELLTVVNVWDVVSARAVADAGATALATASHSIAATFGYEDGEHIPRELMLDMVGRIVASTELPVSADLEAGYGDPGRTVALAIELGVAGANLEDGMRPLDQAVAAVRDAVAAASSAGVPFALNARTDAIVRAGDRPRDAVIADALERGRAYLGEGATCIFVPGLLDAREVGVLVEAFGPGRLSVIAVPGSPSLAELQSLGVARVSYGPWTQRVALTALQDFAAAVAGGGALPAGTRPLN